MNCLCSMPNPSLLFSIFDSKEHTATNSAGKKYDRVNTVQEGPMVKRLV